MPFTLVPIAFEFDQKLGQIRWRGIVIAPGGGGGGGPTLLSSVPWTVPAGAVVGSLLYATGIFTAGLASNAALGTLPVMGMVYDKPTAVTATVAFAGEVPGLAGLVAGQYYAGAAGAMTTVIPVGPAAAGLQTVGVRGSAGLFVFNPGDVFRL